MDNNSPKKKSTRVIFGVCSGLGNLTGIPATVFRALLLFLLVPTRGGIVLAYLIIGSIVIQRSAKAVQEESASSGSAASRQMEARLLQQISVKAQPTLSSDPERGRPQTYKPMPQDAHSHTHETAAHAFSCGGKFDAASYSEEVYYREAGKVRDEDFGK